MLEKSGKQELDEIKEDARKYKKGKSEIMEFCKKSEDFDDLIKAFENSIPSKKHNYECKDEIITILAARTEEILLYDRAFY